MFQRAILYLLYGDNKAYLFAKYLFEECFFSLDFRLKDVKLGMARQYCRVLVFRCLVLAMVVRSMLILGFCYFYAILFFGKLGS